MKNYLILVILCLSVSFQTSAVTIYLIRHAEKLTGKDPELTELGKQRAHQLAELLKKTNVDHIFSTDYKRTTQTAEPLAKMEAKEIEIYDARKLEEFAIKLKAMHGTILVIGHSNTIPELIQLLSNQSVKPLAENDYGDLFQITIQAKKVILQHLTIKINK